MNTHRNTGRTAGTTARWQAAGTLSREAVRTGTVLRVVCGLLTAASFILPIATLQGAEVGEDGTAGILVSPPMPGAIGAHRPPQAGPCPEASLAVALQPVSIRGPKGMTVSAETFEGWSAPQAAPFRTALLVGATYRLRIGGLGGYEGLEVYPTLRILARLATPPGMDHRFPVEVVIDENDLVMALDGGFVRRVVYMDCDPDTADIAAADWFDVRPGDDALDIAATLGAPVAELILGNRLPTPGVVP
ncbi:MAG: hypothetical protein DWH79_03620 [Planctomycetota bacterium]|nr:MAG: hypothetical protein DWH79_03620 [Planctomycetota bacterium]